MMQGALDVILAGCVLDVVRLLFFTPHRVQLVDLARHVLAVGEVLLITHTIWLSGRFPMDKLTTAADGFGTYECAEDLAETTLAQQVQQQVLAIVAQLIRTTPEL